jgi:hypothetical protein
MDRHITLLGILASLWGALAALVGISMLLLAVGAMAIVDDPDGQRVALAAGLTVAVFTTVGILSLLWGVGHVWVAMLLRRRQPLGRVTMLGLAVANLLVFPFGTALGGYALWVLLSNDGRRTFEAPNPQTVQ